MGVLMVGIQENLRKTVEKMVKNGLENNGVYIIWKIGVVAAVGVIIPYRHTTTPLTAPRTCLFCTGRYFIRVRGKIAVWGY